MPIKSPTKPPLALICPDAVTFLTSISPLTLTLFDAVRLAVNTNEPVICASPVRVPSHSAVTPVSPLPFPVNEPVNEPVNLASPSKLPVNEPEKFPSPPRAYDAVSAREEDNSYVISCDAESAYDAVSDVFANIA